MRILLFFFACIHQGLQCPAKARSGKANENNSLKDPETSTNKSTNRGRTRQLQLSIRANIQGQTGLEQKSTRANVKEGQLSTGANNQGQMSTRANVQQGQTGQGQQSTRANVQEGHLSTRANIQGQTEREQTSKGKSPETTLPHPIVNQEVQCEKSECRFCGTECVGPMLLNVPGKTSADECQKSCHESSTCSYYTFDYSTNDCKLYPYCEQKHLVGKVQVVSGRSSCNVDVDFCKGAGATAFIHGNVKNFDAVMIGPEYSIKNVCHCHELCQATDGCFVFRYVEHLMHVPFEEVDYNIKTCWLLSKDVTLTGRVNSEAEIFGFKHYSDCLQAMGQC